MKNTLQAGYKNCLVKELTIDATSRFKMCNLVKDPQTNEQSWDILFGQQRIHVSMKYGFSIDLTYLGHKMTIPTPLNYTLEELYQEISRCCMELVWNFRNRKNLIITKGRFQNG